MASVNAKKKLETIYTHGGNKAMHVPLKQQLERSVMACLLWEDSFYESGEAIAKRIADLVKQNKVEDVIDIATRAKLDMRLRHVPLFLALELAKRPEARIAVRQLIPLLITRPDDATELLALYWKDRKGQKPKKLAKCIQNGIAEALLKFDEYQLSKYAAKSKSVSLKDAIALTHPKPKTDVQAKWFHNIINGTYITADTWESAITSTNKKESWTRLLDDKKLGGMALLRNLRNMTKEGVDTDKVKQAIKDINAGKLLPVNFFAANKHNPGFETEIEEKMLECFATKPKLKGKTILIIDTSGSMHSALSGRSENRRIDVAGILAAIGRELCEEPVIYCTAGCDSTKKHATMRIPARRGFSLVDYITKGGTRDTIGGGGIFLKQVLDYVKADTKTADRIIVLTDEQDCDTSANSPSKADAFSSRNYMINVSNDKNGIVYGGKWVQINGWSDTVFNYITALENSNANLN